MRKLPLLLLMLSAAPLVLSSCCEPASKDSRPSLIDSLFSRSVGYDLDLQRTPAGGKADSGYYPIYTFAIHNDGSQDDIFTLRFRSQYTISDQTASGRPLGFDISQTVPAGQTVLFRTPTPLPDSITSRERITFTPTQDTLPLMSRAYLGFFATTPDSTKLRYENAMVSVLYGAIDNGAEGCNTPATSKPVLIGAIQDK
jgi:hypothetical protein